MLRIFCTWGINFSHNWRGKLLSMVARAMMNESLKVWITHSTALTRWLWGSTRCNSTHFHLRILDKLRGLIVHDIEFWLEPLFGECVELLFICIEYGLVV
jgi:hypothetical protein